jgi:hypothetical protein
MVQGPLWEADILSDDHLILRLLRDLKVQRRINQSTPLVPVLGT